MTNQSTDMDSIKIHDSITGECLGLGTYTLIQACKGSTQRAVKIHDRWCLASRLTKKRIDGERNVVIRGDEKALKYWLS